jgi:hypothetical protein
MEEPIKIREIPIPEKPKELEPAWTLNYII